MAILGGYLLPYLFLLITDYNKIQYYTGEGYTLIDDSLQKYHLSMDNCQFIRTFVTSLWRSLGSVVRTKEVGWG